MEINGVELELDLLDLETAERYEKAKKQYEKRNDAKISKAKTLSETIKAIGEATYELIDMLWGEGTAVKIFESKYHMGKCLDAINAITAEEDRQAKGLNEWTERFQKARS